MALLSRSYLILVITLLCGHVSATEEGQELKFAAEVDTNPMEKVNELLTVLAQQVEDEGKEDKLTFGAHTSYYKKEYAKGEVIVKEFPPKIAQLQSDLQEAEAFREGKNRDFMDLTNELTKNSAELDGGKANRRKEREAFQENEDTYDVAIHQLELSIETMNKKRPEGFVGGFVGASSASLLSVAEKLKATLTQSSDFSLSSQDQQTLNAFVRSAQISSWHETSFLQRGSRGPFGEYESKSPGLIGTLQELFGKVQTERDNARKAEKKAKTEFTEFLSSLTTMIANGKKSLAAIKISIAQSSQQSSKDEISLAEKSLIYKNEAAHILKLETEYKDRTRAYMIRLAKRTDEAIAVHEARRVLGSDIAKAFIKKQRIGILGKAAAASLSQLAREKSAMRRKALHILKHATTPALALLVLKSTAHFKSGTDPFGDVKSMIKGMVVKLNDKQAKESTQSAFCEREMTRNAENQNSKEKNIEKLESRLDSVSAELAQVKSDIAAAGKDMKEVLAGAGTAIEIRDKETKAAAKAMQQYKDGGILLRKGLKALKGYYENKEGGGSEVDKNEFKQRHGLGSGIIAILEIAVDDFDKLYAETKENEEAAAKDFKEIQNESGVRSAVFKRELALESNTKDELERDQFTLTNDLKTLRKALQNLGTYLQKLKSSCSTNNKGRSYAEKKAKRDADLESLKDALEILTDNAFIQH